MNIGDHILERRLAGLRFVAIFLGLMTTLGLIANIISPLYNDDVYAKLHSLLFLFSTFFFAAVYLYSNKNNYNIFAWSSLAVGFVFYFVLDTLQELDYESFFIITGSDPLPSLYAYFIFLLPNFFLLIATIFLRLSFLIIAGIYYSGAVLENFYEVFSDERVFLSQDLHILGNNPVAINETFLLVSAQTFIFSFLACFAIVYLLSKLTSDVAKTEKANFQLGRYFSPMIREEIEKFDFDLNEKPRDTQMVAVMFTDIIGFTKLSEKLEPAEVLELLSQYQERMVAPIFSNNGTVDKFIGDAVMATFGTPVSRGNDAQNALSCARDMQISMREWEKERTEQGKPVLKHRIGIHYGRCVVGNIGSKDLMEFSVIEDTVNVASRICDACKDNDANILISESVKNQVNEELSTELINNFQIRGSEVGMNLHKIDL